jgi:hypothetical protein
MPFPDALAGALGGWSHLANSEVRSLHFYQWVMGVDEPLENLELMGVTAGVWAAVLVPAFIGSFAVANRELRNRVMLAVLVAVVAVVVPVINQAGDIFRPMVVFLGAVAVMAALRAWRPASAESAPTAILGLSVAVLALALMGKIFLKPWLSGYAFALLVPGVLVCVFVLLHLFPVAIEQRGGDGRLFGRVALALLTLVSLGCLLESEPIRAGKTFSAGTGQDRFVAEEHRRPVMMTNLSDWVENAMPPRATLLVMPEGVMVNYLTRRINPTRHVNFMPPELAIFGEEQILADLKANRPDFVALVHRDSSEYKLPMFGTDFGVSLLAWVRANYDTTIRVGPEPLRPVWERTDGRQGWEVRKYRGGPRRRKAGS